MWFSLSTVVALVAAVSAAPRPALESRHIKSNPSTHNSTVDLVQRTGQGGYINIINGSPFTFTQTFTHSYQMNSWSFPATVAPYSASRVYVEFSTTIGKSQSDDSGELTYQLSGTSYTFQLQARAPGGQFTLQSVLTGMSTQNNGQGSTIPLGWVHNGVVNWILSGGDGAFTSSRPVSNWMQTNLPYIGGLTLRQLTVPGSHDSGMSVLTGGTAFGESCNSLTQTVNIGGQLSAGARYFDIRPVITGGVYATGHYTGDAAVLDTFQGANGQYISDIINELNSFTANNKELIVINLSHSLNTDVGSSNYRAFIQSEWDSLLNQLTGINNLLVASSLPSGFNAASDDLSGLALNQLINGRAAVVLVVQDSADLTNWFGKGVYSYGQYGNLYNSYSDTNTLSTMESDQVNKLVNNHGTLFLLSWTLTQNSVQAAICTESILDLAGSANPSLYTDLINSVSPTRNIVPNILYTDNASNGDIIGLAMAYNWWQSHH